MKAFALFLLSTLVIATAATARILPSDLTPSTTIIGYPGVLSREYVRSVVDEEMRKHIVHWGETATTKKQTQQDNFHNRKSKANGPKGALRHRVLKKDKGDDLGGLNDILESFEFELPEQRIEQDFLGSTATFVISGQCSDISIERIGLDYDSKGDDLTYKIDIKKLDVDCILDIKFDFGAYDVEDEIVIDIKLRDNNFGIGVVLEGIPPETSSFEGCEAQINIKEISAEGGFSANILNDLDGTIADIVEAEKPIISQLLCEQVTQFTSVVDGVLMTLIDAIEPYLGKPDSVDPLKLEQDLVSFDEEELVDFTNSDLGYAIAVITDNLQGVFGPFQINTLIELNLLSEDAVFTLDLTEDESTRSLQDEECALFRRGRRNLLSDMLREDLVGRTLQFDDGEEFFTVNSLDILTIEFAGLNTFNDLDPLEIIGKYTFRSKLSLSELVVKATIMLDADVNEVNVKETIEVTLPIEDIDITASYLVGLSGALLQHIELSTLLNTDNLFPCLLSTLKVVGLSELTLSVGEIGVPTVEGALSSGVDELINTATEAAIMHYQELIVDEAIPNIAQKNVTVQFNDFAECFIRTEAAIAVCPEPEETEDGSGVAGLFSFRRLLEKAIVQITPPERSRSRELLRASNP